MYIKDFHIEEFGPLKDFSVNNIPCGMAVFLGNNEAGKSSTMEFVRAMLMGVPTKRNPLTQMIRNSKGGSMKIHDAHHGDIDIIRKFSSNPSLAQLYDVHGNACGNNVLSEIMTGISRDVYRIIYGFNLMELQNVNNFHGSEVLNTILGASFGLGLRGPVLALENIQERIDSIYTTRGKNTILQKLFDEWNKNKSTLDTAFEEVKQFDILQAEQVTLDENLSILKDKKIDIVKKNDELNFFISLYGQWEKWLELQNTIAKLPSSAISFPDNAELVLERILEQKKIKTKDLEDFKLKQNELALQQEEKQPNTVLLAQYDALKNLMEEKGSYRQALSEITSVTVKAEQFSHVLEGVNSRLKEKWQLLDGQNSERNALIGEGMSFYLEKIPHGDAFLNEFISYETKILEAESYVQSAKTALEYAQRNTNLAEEKRKIVEENISQKLEKETSEQEAFLSSHADTYNAITEEINLTESAFRLLPDKLDSIKTTFENWKKQIRNIGISELEAYAEDKNIKSIISNGSVVDDSALTENSALFTLINSEKEKDYYIQVVKTISVMQEQRVKILPVAQKIMDEESSLHALAEKIVHIANKEILLCADSQDFNAVSEAKDKKNPVIDKNVLEIKNQVLQKLQTINELRTQSISRLNDLYVEQNELSENLKEKIISNFALVPGALCLGLGLPLFVLRLLSGENLISFATFFPSLSSSIYVPLWLPLFLILIASLSIYLPLSRKSEAQKDQSKLDELQKDADEIIGNLTALKKEEVSIVLHTFGMSEEQQSQNYEQVKTYLNQNHGLDFVQTLSLDLKFEDIALEENLLEHSATDEIDFTLDESLSPMEDKDSTHEMPLVLFDSDTDEVAQKDNEFSDEKYLSKDLLSIEYVLKNSVIHRENSKILQERLQNVWEKEYTHFIVTEQNNDAIMQAKEKLAHLLNEKKQYEKLHEETCEILEEYRLEWDEFFQQYLFLQGPNPKHMEVFFLRIDACANIQKRLTELNLECETYYKQKQLFQVMAQEKFPEIYSQLESPLEKEAINLSDLILEIEKHIQEMRIPFSQGKDAAIQEATRESAIQAEKQTKDHMLDVKESLRTRQELVDRYYEECVSFLCQSGILSSSDANDYYEKMTNEMDGTVKDSDSPKKIKIALVKQLLEVMGRFDGAMLEYEKLNSDIFDLDDIIGDFESFLRDLMEEAGFKLFYENGKVDYLENFENFYSKIELEVAKGKDRENIENQQSQLERNIALLQVDLDEIQTNMKALLDLASVASETQLRLLIERQKQRDQIIRSSLALEESFSAIELPKFITKSANSGKRQYVGDGAGNIETILELPEIFEYFDDTTRNIWQEELNGIKKNRDMLETNEREIQNKCGILHAKREALIQSARLAHLRCEQLEIEEKIEEAYENWLELSFAKKIVTKARKQYEQNKQPKVIAMASEFFATITNNVWEKIVISIDDKNIKVVGKNGTLVEPEVLSQGAKEQLYLSLRLAHIQNRAQAHQHVPILMDDILVNFDEERIENTIEAFVRLITPKQDVSLDALGDDGLENAVGGQQVLFYTCHERTARMLQDKIAQTKIYLVENKTVRPA